MPSLRPLPEIEEQALGEGSIPKVLEFLKQELKEDTRAGAQKLLQKFEKRAAAEEKESQRLEKLWVYEKEASHKGFKAVAGIDEAGRGPLAGPVVAAAVILPTGGAFAALMTPKD